MAEYWKRQLQELIDLTQDRIRRLEAGEMLVRDQVDARQRVETERSAIARLQKTIDALNAAVPNVGAK